MKNIPDPATYRHKSERGYSDNELLPKQNKKSNKDKKQKYPNDFSKKYKKKYKSSKLKDLKANDGLSDPDNNTNMSNSINSQKKQS